MLKIRDFAIAVVAATITLASGAASADNSPVSCRTEPTSDRTQVKVLCSFDSRDYPNELIGYYYFRDGWKAHCAGRTTGGFRVPTSESDAVQWVRDSCARL